MQNEILSIAELIEKMEAIAFEKYNGNTIDNIYSIYSMLTDIEKITFLKYSYKISASFLFVINMVDLDLDLVKPNKTTIEKRIQHNEKNRDSLSIEERDREGLVSIKHRAIITAGQIVLIMLFILLIIVILLTFASPNALKILKGIGPIVDAIVG